jgi:hypothetical protein
MLNRFLSSLKCLALLLKPDRSEAEIVAPEAAPLDHVERLQRNGSTSTVVLGLARLGW